MTNPPTPSNDDTYIPRRLPIWIALAALAPTILLALTRVVQELGGPRPPTGYTVLFYVWLFTTVPLTLLAIGIKRLPRDGHDNTVDPNVEKALEAVGRAERLADREMQTLMRVDALLAEITRLRAGANPNAPAAPGPTGTRTVAIVAIVGFLVVAGGLGWAFTKLPANLDPVHIHPNFAMYVNNERVNYTHPAFDLNQRNVLASHLHYPNGDVMHIEGTPGQTLGEFFKRATLTTLEQDALTLDNLVHNGTRYENNATHKLRLFVHDYKTQAWTEKMTIPGYIPKDWDRILITYGDLAPEQIATQQASVSTEYWGAPETPTN